MLACDLTLSTPEENLALDEALLDAVDGTGTEDVLRFWEPSSPFVVVGYANRVEREVNLAYCREHDIPVLRRTSGGGTVLQAAGVLNYSLILKFDDTGPLRNISSTNRCIMERNAEALRKVLAKDVSIDGHTDLTTAGRKFSGNAQRRKRRALLFHGSLLLSCDIALIEKSLSMPSSQPDYRAGRRHSDFVTNLGIHASALKAALIEAWSAVSPLETLPADQTRKLAAEKYSLQSWNFRF